MVSMGLMKAVRCLVKVLVDTRTLRGSDSRQLSPPITNLVVQPHANLALSDVGA